MRRDLQLGERRLAEIAREKQQLQVSLKDNAQQLNHQIRVTYMTGKQPYIKMMLNLQDPSRVGRILKYYDYYNYARANRISQIRGDIRQLDAVNRKQQRAIKKQNQMKTRAEKEKRALEKEQRKRRALLAELDEEISTKDKELKVLRDNEQRLEKLLNKLGDTLSEIEAVPKSYRVFAKNKGLLAWPVNGKMLHHFGSLRSQELRWKGVVFQVKPETKVKSIAHGRVAFSDWLRGYGLLTIIDHGDGYMSLYGNNQALFKTTGDWVVAGEVIAEAGRSDGQDGDNSFYFEIRHKGAPINPERWCR
jgi:septal ring factor EnvC (AmiA/AmiB activator)